MQRNQKVCVVKKTLGFDGYSKCLFDPVDDMGKSKSIYRWQLMF